MIVIKLDPLARASFVAGAESCGRKADTLEAAVRAHGDISDALDAAILDAIAGLRRQAGELRAALDMDVGL